MNYLAHLYLSFGIEEVLVGNYIADRVKGSRLQNFPPGIQKGIRLHRMIDTFTDTHPRVGVSKSRIRMRYGKFSGIVVDMYYDHFLAAGWESYNDEPLLDFTRNCYKTLFRHYMIIPARLKRILPWMAAGNWLYAYREIENISLALKGMSGRIKYPSGIENGTEELVKYYDDLKADFEVFFVEAIAFAKETLDRLDG
jgi:acyl carrier protein phosphodiesterase